jgi:DNA-binding NarL/FixJ family response regulator
VFCGTALVVDDDAPTRELVSNLLARLGFEVRGVESGAAALATSDAERLELVVLEVRLRDMSGYEVLRELRERFGDDVSIMFLSGERTEAFDRVGGLLLGADDYMVKPFDPDELMARARALVRRRPRSQGTLEPRNGQTSLLTPREREVLELLARGLEQSDIADQLVISPKTVATHIQRILTKLGVHARAQAVAEAYRLGLVGPAPSSAS